MLFSHLSTRSIVQFSCRQDYTHTLNIGYKLMRWLITIEKHRQFKSLDIAHSLFIVELEILFAELHLQLG